jgi:hypothetical protein
MLSLRHEFERADRLLNLPLDAKLYPSTPDESTEVITQRWEQLFTAAPEPEKAKEGGKKEKKNRKQRRAARRRKKTESKEGR